MRFGIMDMQIGALLPPGELNAEQVVQYVLAYDQAGLVRGLAEHGFRLIELGGDLALFFPNSFAPAAIEKLAALKREQGLSYSVHLPLWSVEPSTPLAAVRQGSAQALVECIRATQALEPESYVLHATGALAAEFYQMRLPAQGKAVILKQFQRNAAESIRRILGETGLPSRKLALETIEFPFELTLELAERLDTSICLDTGHVLVGFSGPVELFDVLEQVLPRLGEIHLHDGPWQGPQRAIGYGKDHQALGKGDLDVGRLLARLERAAWDGPIIFELTLPEALASLDRIHTLRPDQRG